MAGRYNTRGGQKTCLHNEIQKASCVETFWETSDDSQAER